ncbi:TonB-dependent receptor [Sphingomonas bisphenolicum]|uniref:TonB-dependent receptor n=1 Tax=Sphingomonas bisphenolicum TaxID=296544 RepID=A0ABM7FZQ5_9SPHN|nr:TonB-dependent receptor [Sphingomonas bisphenolicum]BBF68467.1 TonB-dependent receptor [Sphingomonas bisphenolicum]
MLHTRSAFARRSSALAIASMLLVAAPAIAQEQPAVDRPAADPGVADIVVTGFRASLSSALGMKRKEAAAIDSIVAEDIGKFPDSNLAESMQRVPGVALARGDGGEGRNISVRGLGAGFTRVRINGMEGTAQTGSSDIYGAGNNGRSFDFNVFPTEIFSALSVRKTPSADVEEGSLGATVDLTAPKPFDQKDDFVLSMTARGVYNELSKKVDPRASLLISKQFGDSGFGILGSVAYQKRHIREVGYSAVDILSANTNGGFCSPIGFAPQNPADNAIKGADALNCSTGNPRTSTNAAYQAIQDLRRDDLSGVAGSGAFLPRIPRYLNSEQNQERIGGSLTLQFQPDDQTDISVDFLYSRFEVTRRDNYIAAISFARSAANNGQPMTSVRDIAFDENGSLVHGVFDGVDVRSEGLVDHFVSTFKQANVNFRRQLNDSLEVSGIVGFNRSIWDGKKRLQTFMDAIDTDNFTIDFRDGGTTPKLGFGIDVNDPASFTYGPGRADGTVLGGFSFQGKPSRNKTDNLTAEANLKWTVSDAFSIRAGAQYRRSDFLSTFLRPYTADTVVRALPAGTSLADITRTISGVDKLWGNGAPASWVAIDPEKWASTFGFDSVRYCGVECGGGRSRVREEVSSAYLMANFDLEDAIGIGIRGDAGLRYVKTDMLSSGYVTVASAASPTGLTGQFAAAKNSYDDWLPSANIVVEPMDNLLLRFSGAKVLARPELGLLTPTSGVNPVTRVGNVNNPFLDPIRATTFDVAVEWYFRPGSLLSAAFFYKDIKSFIQNVNSQIPFNQLGLPDALLENSNTLPTELFTVSQPFNTPGGKLKGIELNAQIPFTFFDGFLGNFGFLGNYTRVTSKIEYILASVNGVPTVTTTADLVGLSKNTASATLYYEDEKFSIRTTGNFRDKFIRGIPASPGSDLQGNAKTFFMDASASYNVTDRLKIMVEATNLTDEQNRLYIDSQRQDTLFETRIGRTFTFGVTYRM